MARVYLGTLGAGVLQDTSGNVQAATSATVKVKATGANATHYSAYTGGSSSTAAITTTATGVLNRWVDGPEKYTVTVGADTYDFDAIPGEDVKVLKEAPINAKNPPGSLSAMVGDGSTSDTTNGQALLAAIQTAGGGSLYLPSSVYRANLTIPWATVAANEAVGKPITIHGDGKRTVLKSVAGSNAHVLATANFDTLHGSGDLDGNWRTTIKNFVIDGDQANNLTGGKGLALYGWQNTVENMIFQNCREEGFHTAWGYGDRPGTGVRGGFDVSMSSYFKFLLAQDNLGTGILHHGPHDAIMVGIDSKGNYGWGSSPRSSSTSTAATARTSST
jgi:hypothetical protein